MPRRVCTAFGELSFELRGSVELVLAVCRARGACPAEAVSNNGEEGDCDVELHRFGKRLMSASGGLAEKRGEGVSAYVT